MRLPAPVRIAGIYVLVAIAWILWSDRVALVLFGDAAQVTWVQTVKGIGFVLVSGLLIGLLVRRERVRWRESERSATQLATRFEALFRSSPAGILIVDSDADRFLDANDRFLEIFRYARGDIVGHATDDVELWDDPAERQVAAREVRETGRFLDHAHRFRRADGSVATMLWSAERVRSGGSTWVVATFVDVSERNRAYEETIEGWARALDLRDNDTAHHSLRVTWATEELARRMGIDGEELVHVRRGALLHDIGKIGVPDSILHKPGPLSDEEWAIMRRHPVIARELLAPITYLRDAMAIPVHHHERWDGSGYPDGLAGEAIPLAARIFAVIDVWDALTSDRPYRPAWSEAKALDHLRTQAGRHFDPRCVDAFDALLRERAERGAPLGAERPARADR